MVTFVPLYLQSDRRSFHPRKYRDAGDGTEYSDSAARECNLRSLGSFHPACRPSQLINLHNKPVEVSFSIHGSRNADLSL